MGPVWTDDLRMPCFPPLWGQARTDVLVIGGGMAGLLCARMLQNAGVDCAVAEAASIAGGITKNTTAKITSQHGLIYQQLAKRFGTEKAALYLQANEQALAAFRTLCAGIDCDFSEEDNYIYSTDNREKLEQEMQALESIGAKAEFAENLPLPFPTVGAVKFPHQAQFHPLKFLSAIADELTIYENTPVRRLEKGAAVTDRGVIRADAFVVATHFPFLNKHGSYFLKLYQQRSYVLALENAPALRGMYLDEQENGLSFREYDGRLILGGGGHRTGHEGGGWNALEQFAKTALSRRQNHPPLGGAGLHEPGRRPLYRPLQRHDAEPLRCLGVQQMGHDDLHGGGAAADRYHHREEKPLRSGLFPFPEYAARPAGGQRSGSREKSSDRFPQTLSPSGLCAEVESSGAKLGLPVPRFPVRGKRQTHRQSRHEKSPQPLSGFCIFYDFPLVFFGMCGYNSRR